MRPSSQTQLGLDSWIQKFLPFHGLFIIIFRIYSVYYYENYKDEIMEPRAKHKEVLSPVFSSAALMFDRLVLDVKPYRELNM